MQFSVGDKIVHPKLGAGEITSEEHRELLGDLDHYYVIKLLVHESILYIPVHKMDEVGVRPVMSRTKIARVLDTLRGVPRQLSKDYRKRQERIQEKLATARPIPIAEAVRDLVGRKHSAKLTQKDEQLLNRGRELLAAEMAMATDVQVFDACEEIDAALEVALESECDEPERAQVAPTAPVSKQGALVPKLFGKVKRSILKPQEAQD